MELGLPDIIALLAGRRADLLVDGVVRCEPGVVIETRKAVSGQEPCFLRLPLDSPAAAYAYPEPLLLESFAQSACLLWACTTDRADLPQVAGVRGATFHRPVRPGCVLRTVAKLVPGTAATMFFCGRTSLVDGPLVMTVDNLVLTVRPPGAVLRAHE
ncbi:MAG TPA: beta-hydroxyacyl-ACP dehydratase [Pseudonocardiaceae bacterium]|nr:beta-hydroxyacyl-ACP dehydratase [Pseudonocardiaceae bacterium]